MRLKEIDVELIEKYGYVIRSCGTISKASKPLGQSLNTTGYYKVKLDVANNKGTFLVHRLVATKFVPKVEGKLFVNHKDGNRLNNAADNLEWCTSSENTQHAYGITEGTREQAISLRKAGMTYAEVARVLKVSAASVSNWVNGRDLAKDARTRRELARDTGRLRYVDGQTIIDK